MALARVGAESVMGPLLPRVADQIKEAISVKGRTRPNCPEALQVHAVHTHPFNVCVCHAVTFAGRQLS